MVVVLPSLAVVQVLNWVGLLLDEVLFRNYRRVDIQDPLFIVGVPRSGTTFLHRTLATDRQYTTFSTWECLFAPSITQKKFWLAVAAIDRGLGRPIGRIVPWIERRVFGALGAIHVVDLKEPEEDYLVLVPILACFILILPFPFAKDIWRMAFFDRDMDDLKRRRVMAFYRACIQKHLYVFGSGRRLLSKNASFAPLMRSLLETFPRAKVICCMRAPHRTVPSQLSSIQGGARLFGIEASGQAFRDRMIEVFSYYYDLVQLLKPHVDHIELICPDPQGGKWRGRIAFPLPGDATQKVWIPPFLRLSRRIRAIKPQTIVVGTPGPYGLFAIVLARLVGARLLFGLHTHYEKLTGLYWNRLLGRINRGYFELCNYLLFKNSSLLLANSPSMVEVARSLNAPKAALMGTPIPSEFLEQPLAPPPKQIKKVFFAGRLAAEKNIQWVLDAAAQLPEIDFVIAGDGPLRGVVARTAAKLDNLQYLGWVPRSRMLSVLDECDMLILPSEVESFGTIALEGTARQKVVLVSKNCGILDWPSLSRGLFSIGDEENLIRAIDRIVRLDPAVRARKAKMAMQSAREQHDWNLTNWLELVTP